MPRRRWGGGALTTLPGAAASGRSAHDAQLAAPQPESVRAPRAGRRAAPLFTPRPADPAPPPAPDAGKRARRPSEYVAPRMPARPVRRPPVGLGVFLGVAVLTIVAHSLAATFTSLWVATASEARFAVAVLAVRDATLAEVPLAPWDHFGAIQMAAVQLVLPAGDPVEAARWAGLALGALATLLMWPVLRGLGNSRTATAAAVGTLGVALPLLALRAGVTTAVAGVVWLSIAAVLAVRDKNRAAVVAAVAAVATVPLAAAPLLVIAAAISIDGSARLPGRLRRPVGVVAAAGALAVVLAAAMPGGPFVATTGPDIPAAGRFGAAAVVLVIVVLAGRADHLLRPVLAAAVPLVLVGLVPGPSAAAAALLVTPVVAVALAIGADQVHARVRRRPLRIAMALALAAVLAVPVSAAAGRQAATGGSLVGWITTQTGPGAVVVADELDRAELRLAGFPAARLRAPSDPVVPGELRLIAERPGATVVPCPPGAVLAATRGGSGRAPAVVCGALTPATNVEADVRVRLGTALTTNSALKLDENAAALLREGRVDPRLMLTLAALTSAHGVGVAAFPAVPLDAPDALRRVVVLSSFDGTSPASSAPLKTWLAGQQAPFAPAGVTGAGPDLVLSYPVPSPTGLLPL